MWIQIHPGKAFDSAPPIFHIFQIRKGLCVSMKSVARRGCGDEGIQAFT